MTGKAGRGGGWEEGGGNVHTERSPATQAGPGDGAVWGWLKPQTPRQSPDCQTLNLNLNKIPALMRVRKTLFKENCLCD